MRSIHVENMSEQNLGDVLEICSRAIEIPFHDRFDRMLHRKSVEVTRRWFIDILEEQGSCAKIAYLDGKPVAQIQFCPEGAIPYIHNPREGVVDILCILNSSPEARRRGAATALLKDLVNECYTGLSCLGGKPCSFMVTRPFASEAIPQLTSLCEKSGFRQGHKEMFLEIKGEYVPREIPEYHPLPEDLDRTIIFYNPACEWGHFYAFKIEEIIRGIDPDHPVEIINIWEKPEGYAKRGLQRMTAGRAIVRGHVVSGAVIWTDREAFRREMEEAMRQRESNHIRS